MSYQWVSDIDTDGSSWAMWRHRYRDMDIYGCVFKNDHSHKSDYSKSCGGAGVCSSATNHGCLRSSSNKFVKLYEQCEW